LSRTRRDRPGPLERQQTGERLRHVEAGANRDRLDRSGLSPQRAVERIRRELPAAAPVIGLLDFIAGARRGICGAAQPGRSALGGGESRVPRPESEPV